MDLTTIDLTTILLIIMIPVSWILIWGAISAMGTTGGGGGIVGLEQMSPYYKEQSEPTPINKESVSQRLKKLKNDGMCILIGDGDNPTEVMDRIPENFPYIIIYANQSVSEVDELVAYGEAMWEGWCYYHSDRNLPKWDDIKPKSQDDRFRWQGEREMVEGYNDSRRSIVNKWAAVLDDVPKPPSATRLKLGFMPE